MIAICLLLFLFLLIFVGIFCFLQIRQNNDLAEDVKTIDKDRDWLGSEVRVYFEGVIMTFLRFLIGQLLLGWRCR